MTTQTAAPIMQDIKPPPAKAAVPAAPTAAPEIVEDLEVKIPAGGQTYRFSEVNPFKTPTSAKPSAPPAAAAPKSELELKAQTNNQTTALHKPVTETILISSISLILCLAVLFINGAN